MQSPPGRPPGVPPRAEALTRAGWSLGFTCHAQNIERVNADGLNTLVCDVKLTYISGKLGKWDLAPMWRDWADHCVYLTWKAGEFGKLEKGENRPRAAAYTGGRRRVPARGAVARGQSTPSGQVSLAAEHQVPDELWALIYGKWAESFDSGALERRRPKSWRWPKASRRHQSALRSSTPQSFRPRAPMP